MADARASSAEAKRLQLNLNVLKRHDPSIADIVDSTSYVVLYRYSASSKDGEMSWVRSSDVGTAHAVAGRDREREMQMETLILPPILRIYCTGQDKHRRLHVPLQAVSSSAGAPCCQTRPRQVSRVA